MLTYRVEFLSDSIRRWREDEFVYPTHGEACNRIHELRRLHSDISATNIAITYTPKEN